MSELCEVTWSVSNKALNQNPVLHDSKPASFLLHQRGVPKEERNPELQLKEDESGYEIEDKEVSISGEEPPTSPDVGWRVHQR